ncbi:MAG: hypothetical protein H0W81_06550 [Chloroflexi bacterium]|nr:hypothetical protein [Chloroflexota bacterium]
MSITFVLSDEFKDFAGGTIFVDDERSLNVGEELERGNGRIEIDETDVPLHNALSTYAPLERLKDAMSKEDLEAEAAGRGIDVEGSGAGGNVLKADLVAALDDDTKTKE